MARRRRAQQQAFQASQQAANRASNQGQNASWQERAEAQRKRNSQLLAGYAANPWTIPGSATAPDVGGRPLDWQEQAYQLGAGRNLQLSQGESAYQRGQAEQHFGYGASGAANPYSQAALLEESFRRSKLGTTNSFAGQGQLHSGAYQRMQGENARNYSIDSDRNRRAYDQTVHGINYGQAQAAANYGMGMDDAAFEALRRALGLA